MRGFIETGLKGTTVVSGVQIMYCSGVIQVHTCEELVIFDLKQNDIRLYEH